MTLTAVIIYVVLLPVMFLYFRFRNRRNITRLMKSRNYDEKFLPKGIKKYNAKLVSCISIIICIIVILRKAFLNFLVFLKNIFTGTLIGFLNFFKEITDNCDCTTDISQTEKTEETVSEVIEHWHIPDITEFLFIAIAVFFAVKYREEIFRSMKKKAYKFTTCIRSIFRKKEKSRTKTVYEGYTDIYETAFPEAEEKPSLFSRKIKLWKKKLKEYEKMPDSKEKLRFGYSLILDRLKLENAGIFSTDTPLEIAGKIKNRSFSETVSAYCPVRYGEHECTKDAISKVDETLTEFKKDIFST